MTDYFLVIANSLAVAFGSALGGKLGNWLEAPVKYLKRNIRKRKKTKG